MKENSFLYVDDGIRDAVIILNQHGFKTFESCEGGEGHCFSDPTIRFHGDEVDLIRAHEICELYNLCVFESKRVFCRQDVYRNNNDIEADVIGRVWERPFNEIVFLIHSETGTIFRPH